MNRGLSALLFVISSAVFGGILTRALRPARATPSPEHQQQARSSNTLAEVNVLRGAQAATGKSDFSTLWPLRISTARTRESLALRLYDDAGHVDPAVASTLDSLLSDARDPDHVESTTLDRRLLQLVFKTAYHFRARSMEVVSAFRKPGRRREGLHGMGKAVDFKLAGVKAAELAAYLRRLPRVGVGVYTHRRTQYVHLDVRERSYYWLDASPPGRTWRERSLYDAAIVKRDQSYVRALDWPEGTEPPSGDDTQFTE